MAFMARAMYFNAKKSYYIHYCALLYEAVAKDAETEKPSLAWSIEPNPLPPASQTAPASSRESVRLRELEQEMIQNREKRLARRSSGR